MNVAKVITMVMVPSAKMVKHLQHLFLHDFKGNILSKLIENFDRLFSSHFRHSCFSIYGFHSCFMCLFLAKYYNI